MGFRGSAQTGAWVTDGTTFYLQDVSGGNPLTADYTLATVVVHLQKSGSAALRFHGGPGTWAGSFGAVLFVVAACFVRPRALAAAGAFLLSAVALAQQTEAQTSATLEQMVAAHKSQQELAQYVFDTQGCKACHTVGQNGKLGFTARGTETAKGFEGWIAMIGREPYRLSASRTAHAPGA